jgi:hypothetical protein
MDSFLGNLVAFVEAGWILIDLNRKGREKWKGKRNE